MNAKLETAVQTSARCSRCGAAARAGQRTCRACHAAGMRAGRERQKARLEALFQAVRGFQEGKA